MEQVGSTPCRRRPGPRHRSPSATSTACTGATRPSCTRRWPEPARPSGTVGRADLRPAPVAGAQPRPGAREPDDARSEGRGPGRASGSTAWRCCRSRASFPSRSPKPSRARCSRWRWAPGWSWWARNFRFGRGRAGDVTRLEALGRSPGLRGARPWTRSGTRAGPISSSRVREALARGAVGLGPRPARPGLLRGRPVVRGDGRGRTIGVPTANLETVNEILPRAGVYAGRVRTPDGVESAGRRQHRPAAHLRPGTRSPSKPTSWTSTATSTAPSSAWLSWSGCATSASSRIRKPWSRRSGPTSRTRGGILGS